ncbi:PucR family transcriptional regulator [Virgibacillus halophilus]|uniref:PucR family transcriptional regulator n=1 Tax=Tigheibacillus halophilus TaxID=361280 RepID=UPI0036F267F2
MSKIITVRHLLKKIERYGVKLISGEAGIDNPVDYINIQEFALKSERIKENGILLTTFKSLLESNDIISHLRWLKKQKINAIGIHTVFVKHVPQRIIDFSNENDFPIFLIPEEVSYQEIMQDYNELLMMDANNERLKAEQVNINMLEAVALDKDAQFIVSAMGKQLKLPVLYVSKSFAVECFKYNTDLGTSHLQQIAGEVMEQLETLNEDVLRYQFGNHTFKLFPIVDSKNFHGILLIGLEKEFNVTDWSIINYGKTALLLEAVKKRSVEKYVKNRDMKIIESMLKTPRQEKANFEDLSSYLKDANYLYLIESDDLMTLNNIFDEFHINITKLEPASLLWIYENQVICLIDAKIPTNILNKIFNQRDIYCGVSEKSKNNSINSIQEKYEQARIGIEIGRQKRNLINSWDELGFDKFLFTLKKSNVLKNSIQALLAPLITHDETFGSVLIKTLHVYLNNYFSLKKSAETLFVHKNTIKYRIAKIKTLYPGVNFEDTETYLLFEIALRLYETEYKKTW